MTQASAVTEALPPEDEELDQVDVLIDHAIERLGSRAPAAALPAIRMALADFYFTNSVAMELLAELRAAPAVAGSGERVRHAEQALRAAMTRSLKRVRGGEG